MYKLIEQVFIGSFLFSRSLAGIVDTPDHTACISLSNQQWMIQITLVKVHPNE